jgi:TPP-dependent pyruvate/acetoin dehydrogenase alpha subunit
LIRYMISQELWDEAYGQQTVAKGRERVEAAVKEFETVTPPKPKDMFRFTFAEMTDELREQMEALLRGNGRVH